MKLQSHKLDSSIPTLLLSARALPAAPALSKAAARRGWNVVTLDPEPETATCTGEIVFYGSLLVAMDVARRFDLAFLEPPLDLLARIPAGLRLRQVEFRRWSDLHALHQPLFVKPADPLAKVFDAGIYRDREQIRTNETIAPDTGVLVAEPVEWLAEYRCFMLNGRVVASSPYLSFGRPLHQTPGHAPETPPPVLDVCRRLAEAVELPPAYVVDVGLIEDRGWAVVEFNPAWCSGLLSADAGNALDVLRRACRNRGKLSRADRRWVVDRV